MTRTTLSRTAALAAVVAAGVLTTTGCTVGTATPTDRPPAETVTVTAAPEGTRGVTLTSSVLDSETCVKAGMRDFAWFEVQVSVHEDLEQVSFELPDADGVRVVGQPQLLLPVNFGGRFDTRGLVTWEGRAAAYDQRQVGSVEDSVDVWTPIEGQTAMPAFHLRLDHAVAAGDAEARLDEVVATWKDRDGGTGTSSVKVGMRLKGCD